MERFKAQNQVGRPLRNPPAQAVIHPTAERQTWMGGGRSEGANPPRWKLNTFNKAGSENPPYLIFILILI